MTTLLHTIIHVIELNQRPGTGPGALDGILVADFSRVLAGPYLTMLLSDLGATVVKVESPDGDQTRSWGPPWRDGVSTYYQSVNRNKRSVVLDLTDRGDNRLARELARRAAGFGLVVRHRTRRESDGFHPGLPTSTGNWGRSPA